jgi:hypothetical protein
MKRNIIKISATILSLGFFILPFFAFAQIANPLKTVTDIPSLVSNVLGIVVKIGGVVAIFFFIWSGFLFVRAQGKPEEITKARTTFINTCIGVALLLGAQLIASIIIGTINSLK